MKKPRITILISIFLMSLTILLSQGFYGISEAKISSREDILDLSKTITVPEASDAGLDSGGATEKSNPFFGGNDNLFYTHAADLPLTRFVLGKVNIDTSVLSKIVEEYNQRSTRIRKVQGEDYTSRLYPEILFSADDVQAIVENAKKAFSFLMGYLGFYLLGIAFICQTVMIGYNGLMHDKGMSSVPLNAVFFKLIFFFMAIYFFRFYTAFLITFSNYFMDAILPIEAQEKLTDLLLIASTTLDDSAGFSGLVSLVTRSLGYACVKILIIVRDVLLALTLVTGVACLALGFFSTYNEQGSDPMREYLSGWLKSFVTMLVWGPLCALVINAMGIISILTASGELTATAIAIFGIASLFVAKDIPDMAKEFGSVALASMVAAMTPIVSSLTLTGGSMTILTGGSLIWHGGRYTGSKAKESLRNITFSAGAVAGGSPGMVQGKGKKGKRPESPEETATTFNAGATNGKVFVQKLSQQSEEPAGVSNLGYGAKITVPVAEDSSGSSRIPETPVKTGPKDKADKKEKVKRQHFLIPGGGIIGSGAKKATEELDRNTLRDEHNSRTTHK